MSSDTTLRLHNEPWRICESGCDASVLSQHETLFALSNGSFGVRGSLEEMPPETMKGVYLGGVFDRGESYTPDMVNLPNFLGLHISFEGEPFGVHHCTVLEHTRQLDMRQGVLTRDSRFKSASGHILRWQSTRFVSLVHPALCVERHTLTPENFSGTLEVRSILDAAVDNFDTWLDLKVRHFDIHKLDFTDNTLLAVCKLWESRYPVAVATRWCADSAMTGYTDEAVITAQGRFEVAEGQPVQFDRYTTGCFNDHRSDCFDDAPIRAALKRFEATGYDALLKEHIDAFEKQWQEVDFEIGGDDYLQKLIRFNLFALMMSGPRHNEKASIGARGLTGERYRGHVYWDTDLFMVPYYVFSDPASARNIVKYRYHMLDGARRNARKTHFAGARFPIQSADTGDEAGPVYDVDTPDSAPRVGRLNEPFRGRIHVPWLEREEVQITSCVIYAMILYCESTGDEAFMRKYGLELLCEVARFWCSRMEWIEENNRYEILRVVGADEWHFHADNNAYTNYMAHFCIDSALKYLDYYQKAAPDTIASLRKKIDLGDEEPQQWRSQMEQLYLPTPNENGIIAQQDGWFDLKPFDKGDITPLETMRQLWATKKVKNMFGGEVNCSGIFGEKRGYQIVKQCDLVILFWLFPDMFDRGVMVDNFDFYERQTVHNSSLSPNVAGIVGSRLGRMKGAYEALTASAAVDLEDLQKNCQWGLHLAAIGGTWMAAVLGFGGVVVSRDFALELAPTLPSQWTSMKYRFHWHGRLIEVCMDRRRLTVTLRRGDPIDLSIRGEMYTLEDSITLPASDAVKEAACR